MTIELNERQYAEIRRSRCLRRNEVVTLASPALLAITRKFLHQLNGSELSVLMCLLSLTVASGRIARDISIREFVEGMVDDEQNVVVCGTGLSDNSVRTALKSLLHMGFVHAYREVKPCMKDYTARLYEINFSRLDPNLALRLSLVLGQNEEKTPLKNCRPPFKNCRGVHISNYVTHVLEERATSSSILAGSDVASKTQQKGDSMPYVGKRVQAAPLPVGNAAKATLEQVTGRDRAKVAARASVASTAISADINKVQMQALFDTVGKDAGIAYRLMVTLREFGYLKKRLAENPPADFKDMLRFSLTHWSTLSLQNRVAAGKGATRGVVKKSLPESPHFQTFCYWYPYFFRVYQNHLSGVSPLATQEKSADRGASEVVSLERALAAANMANQALRKRVAATRVAAPTEVTSRPLRQPPAGARGEDLLAPTNFPDWDQKKDSA